MSTYKLLQSNNTKLFNQLDKQQQKELRKLGYNNRGTDNVKRSADLLSKYWEDNNLDEKVESYTEEDISLEHIIQFDAYASTVVAQHCKNEIIPVTVVRLHTQNEKFIIGR